MAGSGQEKRGAHKRCTVRLDFDGSVLFFTIELHPDDGCRKREIAEGNGYHEQ